MEYNLKGTVFIHKGKLDRTLLANGCLDAAAAGVPCPTVMKKVERYAKRRPSRDCSLCVYKSEYYRHQSRVGGIPRNLYRARLQETVEVTMNDTPRQRQRQAREQGLKIRSAGDGGVRQWTTTGVRRVQGVYAERRGQTRRERSLSSKHKRSG
ncbi:uncharacterized protein [Dermacentor albipictus]|uniref:uncharacterized protein n=1 Tax=Dermacentor albipictus TaxID=60249 RepID=UPI0038FD3357